MAEIYYRRVILNNTQRISGTANAFTIDLKETFNLQNVTHIAVESLSVPNLQYNVSSTTNTFKIRIGAGLTQDCTIDPGQYDISTFLSALTGALDTLSGVAEWTLTQDTLTRKLKFSNSNQIFTIVEGGSTMLKILGFDFSVQKTATHLGPGSPYTMYAEHMPDLGGAQSAFWHSDTLANSSTINGSTGSINLLSYLSFHDTPFGGVCTRHINDIELSKIRYSQPRNLSVIRCAIRDVDRNLLDIGNSEAQLVFRAYYEI